MGLQKLSLNLLITFFIIQVASAADFEGNITMVKRTMYDTTEYFFSVKENYVRIDIKNSRKEIIQSLLIDLSISKIVALSPNYKLYTNIQIIKDVTTRGIEDYKVSSTGVFKQINGYKCSQWRVRNDNFNTEVSFWVFESTFTFYQKLTSLLCSTEDYSNICEYFVQIHQKPGYLPIMAEERTLLREEKSKMIITNISPKQINAKVFQIPSDYKFLRN